MRPPQLVEIDAPRGFRFCRSARSSPAFQTQRSTSATDRALLVFSERLLSQKSARKISKSSPVLRSSVEGVERCD